MDLTKASHKTWHGWEMEEFLFEGRRAILIFPGKQGFGDGRWGCKMEYFGAFPALEWEMLENGFHIAYLENDNRWGCDSDHEAKVRFADYLAEQFGLSRRFIPIGLSCGGLHAVNFASRYPERVELLYLDAPVMNLLSCPMGFGIADDPDIRAAWQELERAYGFTRSSLLSYREHPIDRIPILVQHRIPVALIYGDSDRTVPYIENGKLLEDAYREGGLPLYCVGKEGCGHHPHGLTDYRELMDFMRKQLR